MTFTFTIKMFCLRFVLFVRRASEIATVLSVKTCELTRCSFVANCVVGLLCIYNVLCVGRCVGQRNVLSCATAIDSCFEFVFMRDLNKRPTQCESCSLRDCRL